MTPTRNEVWIVKPFVAAAKTWASHIIVADQGSTDGTLQQLRNSGGVQVVLNDSPAFDERHRQHLLINHARSIDGQRLLVALDADEALSANCVHSQEWARLREAKPGTGLRFRWVNILPGFKKAWIPHDLKVCGFIDDGTEHRPKQIHSRRVPWRDEAPAIDLQEVVVLHFQYLAWDRMERKHRWYQAWELVNDPQRSPISIFRQYHHMYGNWDPGEIQPLREEWIEGFDRAGIDFRSLKSEPITWWDREIVKMLTERGPAFFRKLAIWDQDWNAMAARIGDQKVDLADPRSLGEKVVHRFLVRTQKHRSNYAVRAYEKILRALGW